MLKVLQPTPYTPIFPPPLPNSDSPLLSSLSVDPALRSSNDPNKTSHKTYIDRLKERHLLLSGLPEELCPSSRETSPEAETRIEALTLRMRKARELHLPLELVLTCVGVRGGDWVGVPISDGMQEEREYYLPATEEEWFEWETKQTEARDRWRAERKATEYREKIEKWSEAVEKNAFLDTHEVSRSLQEQRLSATNVAMDEDHGEDQCVISRYFPPERSPEELLREQSEPVERHSSPIPPAPALDPLPEFCDSFSLPDSPPLLPCDTRQKSTIPDDIPFPPSFAVKDVDTSTPVKRSHISEPVLQLSSPISPSRCSGAAAQAHVFPMSKQRSQECDPVVVSPLVDGVSGAPSTPRGVKRARTVIEPITPKSVGRSRGSQELNLNQDPKRLPTLDALLATSPRRVSSRKGTPMLKGKKVKRKVVSVPSGSPSLQPSPSSAVLDFSSSQPTYSRFRPQFQSTQQRALSLPPSPNPPITSTQPISPQKTFGGTSSSGIGFYQSQFNVESRVDQVTAFLNADVWNVDI